jgi:cysteinyl-tRNA synthetase
MTPAETQAAFSEMREALEAQLPKDANVQHPIRRTLEKLARIESEVARLAEERDHYRFHFDQQEQRAEKVESEVERLEQLLAIAHEALSDANVELARLERIEEAARVAAEDARAALDSLAKLGER